MDIPNDQENLMREAHRAREKAYTPYSLFKVGAALLTEDGEIIHGCNIENASYGLSNCAERTALFKAYAEEKTTFKAMAVVGQTEGPISPCGACRQVMMELCPPDMPVYLGNLKGNLFVTTVAELLPGAFLKGDLYGGSVDPEDIKEIKHEKREV
jgi:cytidine deaminase